MPKRRGPQFRYQLFNHRPSNQFTSPVEWDAFITSNLVDLLDKEPAVRSVKTETEEYRELFDEYILFQAKTLGWRILLSTGVQFRMSRWDFQESGPEKY